MGGRQIRPARVLQTVSEELNHNVLGGKSIPTPPWYNIMQSVPPAETLVRNVTPRLRSPNLQARKPKNLYRPQGICVVQRQLWLMEKEKLSEKKAYDITRREFYRLRQEEEIEKRVALEEAKHVGAYFGKSRIDVSHQLEDREFENWKIWAGKETERQEASRNSEIEDFGLEEVEEDIADDAEPEEKAEAVEGKKSP
ncbi:mitochondrial ribosomal small subunit [Fusarium sp. NRRL 25303]|nr:mitochondrial ribosomal small subunit [Fusarium sp. NRRL 25303]